MRAPVLTYAFPMTTQFSQARGAPPALRRNAPVVLTVLALHGAVLWAMHSGLLQRATELVVPVALQVDSMASATAGPVPTRVPRPVPTQRPQAAATPPARQPHGVSQPPSPAVAAPPPAPSPVSVAPSANAPAPSAPASAASASSALAATATSPTSTGASANGTAPTTLPAPPKLELPSSDADYLNNARPTYPPASKRLREMGLVVVRVFIGTDGHASQASVKQSSGFERLDQASVETALQWRYVPGKRAGVPQGMWFDLPFNWQLTR